MNRTMDEMNEILRLKKLVKNSAVIPQGWFFISFFHFTESQITEFYRNALNFTVPEKVSRSWRRRLLRVLSQPRGSVPGKCISIPVGRSDF